MKNKIYVFGNPIVAEDSLAVDVAKKLEKELKDIEFIYIDPNEEINDKEIVILDVACGIKKVSLLNDLDQLELGKKVSLHDFDTTFSLKLMKKIGLIKKVTIIAIPINYNRKKAYEETLNQVHLTFKK